MLYVVGTSKQFILGNLQFDYVLGVCLQSDCNVLEYSCIVDTSKEEGIIAITPVTLNPTDLRF